MSLKIVDKRRDDIVIHARCIGFTPLPSDLSFYDVDTQMWYYGEQAEVASGVTYKLVTLRVPYNAVGRITMVGGYTITWPFANSTSAVKIDGNTFDNPPLIAPRVMQPAMSIE